MSSSNANQIQRMFNNYDAGTATFFCNTTTAANDAATCVTKLMSVAVLKV